MERLKKWTPLWRAARVPIKMLKAPHAQTTFGSGDVEKVDAVVRAAQFQVKTDGLTPLLEVEKSKQWTPLWREAPFQVKSVKN